MKVVLFCGGLGTRLKEYSETIPKPMVEIGQWPIMWHLMKYYAHYGHTEFILCLGYGGEVIRNYFLNYNECLSNDFVLSDGGRTVTLLNQDISDWTITFVDTGLNSNIGQRLMAVKRFLGNDEHFLANYADGLSDLDLSAYIEQFHRHGKAASFLCVRLSQSFHVVTLALDGEVTSIQPVQDADLWINGGYFIFHRRSLTTCDRARTWSSSPSSGLLHKISLSPIGIPASGPAWIPSKKSVCLTSVWQAAARHGLSGTSRPSRLTARSALRTATLRACLRRWSPTPRRCGGERAGSDAPCSVLNLAKCGTCYVWERTAMT